MLISQWLEIVNDFMTVKFDILGAMSLVVIMRFRVEFDDFYVGWWLFVRMSTLFSIIFVILFSILFCFLEFQSKLRALKRPRIITLLLFLTKSAM